LDRPLPWFFASDSSKLLALSSTPLLLHGVDHSGPHWDWRQTIEYPIYRSCLSPVPCVATDSLHEEKLAAICKEFVVTLPTPQVKYAMRCPCKSSTLRWGGLLWYTQDGEHLSCLSLSPSSLCVACILYNVYRYALLFIAFLLKTKGWGRDHGLFNSKC
jgi:hypothetical protein